MRRTNVPKTSEGVTKDSYENLRKPSPTIPVFWKYVVGVIVLCNLLTLFFYQHSLASWHKVKNDKNDIWQVAEFHKLQTNNHEDRRVVCLVEVFKPATIVLFKKLSQFYKKVDFPDTSNHFKDGNAPASMIMPDSKTQFVGFLTQEYCPKQTSDKECNEVAKMIGEIVIPEDIHAMSRGGKGFVTGGLYNADLVLEALYFAAGPEELNRITSGGKVLDWGGSSGRSIGMMKAAYPGIDAHNADPILKSIEWANDNLKGVSSYKSPVHPPTEYGDNKFDLIFAISIWSHYNFGASKSSKKGAGILWLEEMRRIIKPDGYLIITTHGFVAAYSKVTDMKTAELVTEAIENKNIGQYYVAAFPNNVDWDKDTTNPDWGMSWINPEWLAEKISNDWKIVLLLNGRSDCLQDVLVLQPVT